MHVINVIVGDSPQKRMYGQAEDSGEADDGQKPGGKKAKSDQPPSLLDLNVAATPALNRFSSDVSTERQVSTGSNFSPHFTATPPIGRYKRDNTPDSTGQRFQNIRSGPQGGRYGGQGPQPFKRRKLADGSELVDSECCECPVTECNQQTFETSEKLEQHWQQLHEKVTVYIYYCSKCLFEAGQKYQLKGHYKREHGLDGSNLQYTVENSNKKLESETAAEIDPGNFKLKKVPYWKRKQQREEAQAAAQRAAMPPTPDIPNKPEPTYQPPPEAAHHQKEAGSMAAKGKNEAVVGDSVDAADPFLIDPAACQCAVPHCYGQRFQTVSSFQDHWNKYHVKPQAVTKSVLVCAACDTHLDNKMQLENHYSRVHNFIGVALKRMVNMAATENVTRTDTTNFYDPGKYRLGVLGCSQPKPVKKTTASMPAASTTGKVAFSPQTAVNKSGPTTSVEYVDPTCRQCPVLPCMGEMFYSPKDFQKHWQNVHERHNSTKNVYLCTSCPARLDAREDMEAHYKIRHFYKAGILAYHMSKTRIENVKANTINVFIDPGKYKIWQPGNTAQPFPATKDQTGSQAAVKPKTQEPPKQTPPQQAKPAPKPSPAQPAKTQPMTPVASQKQEVDSSFIVDPAFGKCLVPVCSGKKFRSAKEVEEHWHKVHEVQTIMKTVHLCITCSGQLDNQQQLQNHYKSKHLLVGTALGFYMDSSKTQQIPVTSTVGYINPGKYKLRPGLTPVKPHVIVIEGPETSTPAQTGFIIDPILLKCLVPTCSGKHFMSVKEVQDHWQTIHVQQKMQGGRPSFMCLTCTFRVSSKDELMKHYKQIHYLAGSALNYYMNSAKPTLQQIVNTLYINPGKYKIGQPGCSKTIQKPAPQPQKTGTAVQGQKAVSQAQKPVSQAQKPMYQPQKTGTTTQVIKPLLASTPVSQKPGTPAEKKTPTQAKTPEPISDIGVLYVDPAGGKCPVAACMGKMLSSIQDFKKHWQTVHEQTAQATKIIYQCNSCSNRFDQKIHLETHYKGRHYYLGNNLKYNLEKTKIISVSIATGYLNPGRYRLGQPGCNKKEEAPGVQKAKQSAPAQSAKATPPQKTAAAVSGGSSVPGITLPGFDTSADDNIDYIKVAATSSQCPVTGCFGKSFRTAEALTQHWQSVHDKQAASKEIYVCTSCTYRCETRSHLENHFKGKHFFAGNALKVHMEKAHVIPSVATTYVNPGRYRLEGYVQVTPKQVAMPATPKQADTAKPVEKKMEVDKAQGTEVKKGEIFLAVNLASCQCPVAGCFGKTFSTTTALKDHWKNVHEKCESVVKTVLICNTCKSRVDNREDLENHYRLKHYYYGKGLEHQMSKLSTDKKSIGTSTYIDPGRYRLDDSVVGKTAAPKKAPEGQKTTPIKAVEMQKPATPGAKPAASVTKTATPAAKPATPASKSATPAVKPTTPTAKPPTPVSKPAAPAAKPTQVAKPVTGTPEGEVQYVDPNKCQCPVPVCKGKTFSTALGFKDHWRMLHEKNDLNPPRKQTYICTVCSGRFETKDMIEDHYKRKHFFVGNGLKYNMDRTRVEFMQIATTKFVDPGKYRLKEDAAKGGQATKPQPTMEKPAPAAKPQPPKAIPASTAQTTTVTKTPAVAANNLQSTTQKTEPMLCSVPFCKTRYSFTTYAEMKNHWNNIHVEHFVPKHFCKVTGCNFRVDSAEQLTGHYTSKHYFAGKALQLLLENPRIEQVKVSPGYVNPREFSLPPDPSARQNHSASPAPQAAKPVVSTPTAKPSGSATTPTTKPAGSTTPTTKQAAKPAPSPTTKPAGSTTPTTKPSTTPTAKSAGSATMPTTKPAGATPTTTKPTGPPSRPSPQPPTVIMKHQ